MNQNVILMLGGTLAGEKVTRTDDASSVFGGDWEVELPPTPRLPDFEISNRGERNVTLYLKSCDEWFRICSTLPREFVAGSLLELSFELSGEADEDHFPFVEWIEILESDSITGRQFFQRVASDLPALPRRSHTFRFIAKEFDEHRSYHLAIQISRPGVYSFDNLHLRILETDNSATIGGLLDESIEEDEDDYMESAQGEVYRTIWRLNNEISKRGINDYAGWLLDMVGCSIRAECLETARGLVENMIALRPKLSDAQALRFANYAVDVWFAHGEKDRARDYLIENFQLIFKDRRLHAAAINALSDSAINLTNPTLADGKPNLYMMAETIRATGRFQPQYLDALRDELNSNPQSHLLLWNSFYRDAPQVATSAMNTFLRNYNSPELMTYKVNEENLLCTLEFRRQPPVYDDKKVTVIMSAYNSEKTIEYAVKSILSQSYWNLELLVCDDGSSDNTVEEILNKFDDKRLKIFKSAENQGTYNIRNALIQHASGDYITFADSDDVSLPNRILNQVRALLDEQYIGCLARWIRIYPDGSVAFFRDQHCLRLCVVSTMVRKTVFDECGYFDPVLSGADSDFFERIRRKFGDERISMLKSPEVFALWSARSLTRTADLEVTDDGYRSPKRRAYAELTGRRRALGTRIYSEAEFVAKCSDLNIYRVPKEINLVRG